MQTSNHSPSSVSLAHRLESVRARLARACEQAGRKPDEVALLAVSKRHPPQAVADLHALGQTAFGENYASEAVDKMRLLAHLPLEWHYIGPLQSNKTRLVAGHFHWVQSIDRLKLVRRLDAQRPAELPPLQVCLQLKLGDEATKSGASEAELPALAEAVAASERLRLRGLMCIPPAETDPARQRGWFARARTAYEELRQRGHALDTLSMGMSNDLEAAVAEGSTMVRIGTALFGPRT